MLIRTGFAVRAFNIEIATLQDQISDMKIGEMRFKFWETSLVEIYKNKIPKHPVLIELFMAAKTHKLSLIYLKRLISSREKYMLNSSLKTIEDLETYAENSVSPVYYLFLEAMEIYLDIITEIKDMTVDHTVSHLGKCQGIVNIIRGIPYNSKSGRISIPQEVLLKYKVSYENIIRNSNEKNVRDAIYELASRANSHLMKARKLEKEGNKRIKSICLPFVPLHLYLEKLRKADFNVFDKKLQERNNLLPMKLFWHKIVG
ncbi:NADH dehydrogenase (ubiquinone) complex I, assembly factor 6 [Aphis craccivora]|uniref:NADH dehydrogenase (Ubiquinone) complex I, assembly factor 6 n=1 Tax=Aphis craccivora TaxID=307492 RepID=A0A6G0YV69_APHCR|nr:NADH dehydrogenase (ubiquinone) complex I, assembly factor 6 [Aphis craccivora]